MSVRGLPPGPKLPALLQGVGFWTRPLAFHERCRAKYGKRYTLNLPGSPPLVMLSDPADIKEVFTAPPEVLHPGEGAKVLQPIVGRHSVILLDENDHMRQRKLMLPAFHGEKMLALSDLMREVAETEVATWTPGEARSLHPSMQRLTLEIILRAAFGLEPGPRLDELRDLLARILAFGDNPLTLIPPPPAGSRRERMGQRYGPLAGLLADQAEADRLIFEQIDERRADPGDRDDVLTLLLGARDEDDQPMTAQELRDELMTLLAAGHETTASSLAWTFTMLPREPEALRRLTAEVDADEGDDYLTAVIRETLRARPVLPNVAPRLVKQPITINGQDYPVGVSIVGNSYLVHHDPDIYPDPYRFRPERFLEEKPGTYTWIPFGGGRRRCLGSNFAMQEMSHVLRAVIAQWELAPTGSHPEAVRRRNITIRPSAGALAGIQPRTREPVPA